MTISASFDLTGRVALVTGAGRGIGRAIAFALADSGATVVLNGRSQASLQDCLAAFANAGPATAVFDITDLAAARSAVERIEQEHGRLDILVNNVGVRDRRDVFEFEPGAFERMLQANLVAPFELARLAARGMLARGWGRIVNITSIAGPLAGPGDAIYTAAKGGLEAMTRSLSAEFGPGGVTVNAIAPGFIATETNAARVDDPATARWLEGRTNLGRWADPSEVAGPAVFLASEAASYVTGHVLVVDGGMVARF